MSKTMYKIKWWSVLLFIMASGQLIIALIAEFNGDTLKAIYEMMWAGLFVYLLHKETTDE